MALPLHDEYAKTIEGRYADIVNVVETRKAASIVGRRVPRRFTGDVPWAHVDIAGTAWNTGRPYARQGRLGLRRAAARGAGHNGAMDFDLSDDHELIRRTVRDFAEGEVAPVAEELDRTKSFPYEIVAKLGELGLMGIPFPEEYGGSGGDSLAYALAVEELTRVDSSVAITMCAHTSLGTQPVYLFGSEEQKQRLLPDLCAGRKLGAFGLTEPEAGSDAGNVRTRAALRGRRLGDQRRQAVHHQRGHRHLRPRRDHRPDRRRARSPT